MVSNPPAQSQPAFRALPRRFMHKVTHMKCVQNRIIPLVHGVKAHISCGFRSLMRRSSPINAPHETRSARTDLAHDSCSRPGARKSKNPGSFEPGLCYWSLAVSYSHMAIATLSSALSRFTSVFGMGTGGSNSLLPPSKLLSH